MSWISVNPVRQVNTTGLLGDIESQLSAAQYRVYSDPDLVTSAHEMTHGICARLRNAMNVKNVWYVGYGRAFHTSQSHITLADLAKKIPSQHRGMGYQLYLIQQQQYWNDDAAYLVEELTCYLNGTAVGVERSLYQRTKGSFQSACEFLYYVMHLRQLTMNDEIKEYIEFVHKRMIEQVAKLGDLVSIVARKYLEEITNV
jgi:hypothetical protein